MHILKIIAEIFLGIFLMDAALVTLFYIAAIRRDLHRESCEMCRIPEETRRAA